MNQAQLANVIRQSPLLSRVFDVWDDIALPDSWLVAGAVAQTYWNHVHRYPAEYGIKDVDIVYFDASDLSEASEQHQADRVGRLFHDIRLRFDVKNEARVHLWYEQKFGYSIDPYSSAASAIATFPTTAGAIGIRPVDSSLEFCVPFGTGDLVDMIIRPNKIQITRDIYQDKIERWRTRWPQLTVLDWHDS